MLKSNLSAFDPIETWAPQDFRSAKALFVPSLGRDMVASIACTRPPAGGSHGNAPPAARTHIHPGLRGGVAAGGARAATEVADHRFLGSWYRCVQWSLARGFSPKAPRTRLVRRAQPRDRVSMGERKQ